MMFRNNFLPSRKCRLILLCALLPIIICTLIAEAIHHYEKRPYIYAGFGSSSTLKTAYWALPKIIHPSDGDHDSWYPMLKALAAFHLEKSKNIYQATFLNHKLGVAWRPKFQYPPSSLLPLEMLTDIGLLPRDDAFVENIGITQLHGIDKATRHSYRVLNGINAIFFVLNALLVGYLTRLAFAPRKDGTATGISASDRWWLAGCAVLVCFLFYPYTQAINLGQVQVWLDLIITVACIAWLYDKHALAGACMALICAIKPQIGLMLIWALLWRDWRFVRGFLFTGIPIAAISLWRYGLANHIAYLKVLSMLSRNGESYLFNASLNGLLHRFLFEGDNISWSFKYSIAPYDPWVYAASLAAFVLFVAAAFLPALFRKGQKPNILDLGVATTCFTIGSPVAWDHHYGFLLPFLIILPAWLLGHSAKSGRITGFVLLVLSWTLIANLMTYFNLFADSHLNILESYRFFGGVIFLALLLYYARNESLFPGKASANQSAVSA